MTTVTQGSTKRVLRQAVGRNLVAAGGLGLTNITAAANGSTTTFLSDLMAEGSAGQHKGKWWLGTDAPNDGVIARVTGSSVSSNRTTLTLFPAVSSTLADDTAELWDGYNPTDINNYLDQAIMEITGKAYDPQESIALHADGRETRFDIPTEFAALWRLDYRWSVENIIIDNATDAWDESVDSNVTASQDTKDYKQGPGSFKMVVASGASTNVILATNVVSANISGMDYVEFWFKSTVAMSAGDYQLLLDDTASCASPLETLNLPAITADTWTFVRIALANPALDTSIISVGLKQVTDIGAATVWINRVQAVLANTAKWATLHKDRWGVEAETRDLVLKASGKTAVGYALMKLVGGNKPTLFTAETTVNEVDDWYVICRATALALAGPSGSTEIDPDARRQASQQWELRAQQAKMKHHVPQNTRTIG